MRTGKSRQLRRLRRQRAHLAHARAAQGEFAVPRGALAESTSSETFLLQALMNTIPDHVYFKDRDSRIIMISRAQAHQY